MSKKLRVADWQRNRDYLLTYLKFWRDAVNSERSLPGMIVAHGKLFESAERPKHIAQDKLGMCFMNAAKLVFERPELKLTYCEGYAMHLIPTIHAWCIDSAGRIIDSTWDDSHRCAYAGIAFDRDWARRCIFKKGTYGLLAEPRVVRSMFELKTAPYLAKQAIPGEPLKELV